MSNNIKLGAVLSYFSIFLNIAAGMLFTPWMIQQIGQSQYGLYTLVNSLITIFLVDFGLSSATSRYLAKYNAKGDKQKSETFLAAVYKLYIVIDIIIFAILVIVFFFIDAIYLNLTPRELEQFKVVYIISAVFSVVNFPFVTLNGILTAYEKFVYLKLADVIYRIFYIGFTFVALMLNYGLYALVSIHAAAGLLVVVYKSYIIKKYIPLKVNLRNSGKHVYKEIFGFSVWVTVSSLAQRLMFNIMPSVLGIVSNTVEISVFGIITTVESYVYTVVAALNGMFLPRIAQIMTEEQSDRKLNALLLKVGKYQYILNGVIVAGFAVLGIPFIDFWVGNEYRDAYWGILLVLIPGFFYNSLQIANTTMIVAKKVDTRAKIDIIVGVVNVIISFPLAQAFGVIGACTSIFVAYMVRAIILNVVYHKILPFDMVAFSKKCYLRLSVPVLLTTGVGMMIAHLVGNEGLVMMLVNGLVVVAVYAALTYYIGLARKERAVIIDLMVRVFGRLLKRRK